MTNVPAELAQYVKELQEQMERAVPDPGLSAFSVWRLQVERRLEANAVHKVYKNFRYKGEGELEDFIGWVMLMKKLHELSGWAVTFSTDYGPDIVAEFSSSRPYTAEEKEQARVWLADNPEPEPQTVKWRKPVPFSYQST